MTNWWSSAACWAPSSSNRPANTEHPEIQTITMDPTKTNAIMASYRQGNFHWHIDGATVEIPQKTTLLTAREVDPAGGDTEFANTYAAYDALSDAEKAEIESLHVVHSFAHAQSLANPDPTDKERAAWDRVPDPGAPTRLDPAQRAQVAAARRDGGRSRRLARRRRVVRCSIACWTGRRNRSSGCGITGARVTW